MTKSGQENSLPTLEEIRRIIFFGVMERSGGANPNLPQEVIEGWFAARPSMLIDFVTDVKSALLNWENSPRSGRACATSSATTPRPIKRLLELVPVLHELYSKMLASDDETLHGFLKLLSQLFGDQDA